jgi:hypothetical protein
MSRFKVKQKVWYDRGKHERELTVKKVIDNPMLPVYQYAFEEVNFVCGEQSLRAKQNSPDLKIRDCYKKHDNVLTMVNSLATASRQIFAIEELGVAKTFGDCLLGFKPDFVMVKWLAAYAKGRLIIDVGSGQGHLIDMLERSGAKCMGVDPEFDLQTFMEYRLSRGNDIPNVNTVLPRTIESCANLINGMGKDKVLLVFARPDEYGYVLNGLDMLDKGIESLYIATGEDFEYDTHLKYYKGKATLVAHEGRSEDNENVYSIVK